MEQYLTSPPSLDPDEPITFEIYYGVSSPWALLGAPEAERIAREYGLTIHLKPITVVEENGGIRVSESTQLHHGASSISEDDSLVAHGQLKTRHPARQAYHALDLARWSALRNIPVVPAPRYYPPRAGCIQLAGEAIIRLQRYYGIGHPTVLRYSYAIQRAIWVTERDYNTVEVLRAIASECGIPEDTVKRCVVDARDTRDEGVEEWETNHQEAIERGTCEGDAPSLIC